MNTKFSFTLLAALIVLSVSLAVTTSFTNRPKSAAIPVSGVSEYVDYYQRHSELRPANDNSDYYERHSGLSSAETAREAQSPRLLSGEVFLSDNDSPDLNIREQGLQCMSEDSQPRRYGGCVE